MKNYILIGLFTLCYCSLEAQTVTLEQCVSAAINRHPISKNLEILEQMSHLSDQIIRNDFLPNASVNGQAAYQSDVPSLELGSGIPGLTLPEIPHFQYKGTIDISQVIYDGGLSSDRRELNQIDEKIAVNDIEIQQYKIRQTIEDVYLAILLTQEQKSLMRIHLESLKDTGKRIMALLEEGVLIQSDYDLYYATVIENTNQLESICIAEDYLLRQLGQLSGLEISKDNNLLVPSPSVSNLAMNRPEMVGLDLKRFSLDKNIELLSHSRRPKVGAFGQIGYGRPGINFFNEDNDEFFIAGLQANWQIWDWNRVKRQKDQLSLKSKIIENQKESFVEEINSKTIQLEMNIAQIVNSIQKEESLVQIFQSIAETSELQLHDGMITMNDFIQAQNRVKVCQQNLSRYKIELVKAKQNLITLRGE